MKLALIPPIDLLEYTEETNLQLMLPHLLQRSERYRYIYKRHCEDPGEYVILDNGEAEGVTPDWDYLWSLLREYQPDEFVIPDVIADMRKTIDRAKEWRYKFSSSIEWSNRKYMFVIQGRTMEEFKESINWALQRDWIDVIGIPRHCIETLNMRDARWLLAANINRRSKKPIHLLGAAAHFPDEMHRYDWAAIPTVRSTDTSSPFNFAHKGMSLDGDHLTVRRPENYFHMDLDDFVMDVVDRNVQLLMEWTGNDL